MPIVIWAYLFSYIDNNILNRQKFIIGIFGGILSILAIISFDKINIEYINLFKYLYNIKDLLTSFKFIISISIFLFIIFLLSFIFSLFFNKQKSSISLYLKNILSFLILLFIVLIFLYLFNIISQIFPFLNSIIDNKTIYGEIAFNSIKLLIFYYLIIAIIEESSKYFNFFENINISSIKSVRSGVMFSIFIALGFSFIENIIYIKYIYDENGINYNLFKIYFFRSIFSVIVHIFCSSIIAYYFSLSYIRYKENLNIFPFLKISVFGLFLGISLHMLFDLSLSLGFSFIMFMYLIAGYFYISSIFYKENI